MKFPKHLAFISVFALSTTLFTTSSARGYNPPDAVKPSTVASNAMFSKKWGDKYNTFIKGVVENGWSKTFFRDMSKIMPKRFKMEKTDDKTVLARLKERLKGETTHYTFIYYCEDGSTYEGYLVFKGKTLLESEISSFR